MKLRSSLAHLVAFPVVAACGAGASRAPSPSTEPARAASSNAPPQDPFVPQTSATDAGARDGGAATTGSAGIAPADLAFVAEDTAFSALALDGDRLHVIARPGMHAAPSNQHGPPSLSTFSGLEAFVIERGCLREHARLPSPMQDDMEPLDEHQQPMLLKDPRRPNAVLARDTEDIGGLQRFFAGTTVHDFGMHYAWTSDVGVRVDFENLAPAKDSDRRRMTILRGIAARNLPWNATAHWIDRVLASDEGHLFAVGGFMGDATATIGRLDPDTGVIDNIPGDGVAGAARLDGDSFVVLRFDKAKRRLCFDRLRSSNEESTILCLDKTSPAHLPNVVVAPGGHMIAAAIAGPKRADYEGVVVIDVQAGREVQRVTQGDLAMAVSPDGQLALQDAGQEEPIRIMNGGKLARSVAGALGPFTASGDLVVLDGDALRRKQTCDLVRTVSGRAP